MGETQHSIPELRGNEDALRVYVEFNDGKNRGMYNPQTGGSGFPDENFDATTSMVVHWHKMPEETEQHDGWMRYRKIHPGTSPWTLVQERPHEFWFREERIFRSVLTALDPGSVYEFQIARDGKRYRFQTLPASLEERDITLVMTADHQSPDWSDMAKKNARLAALTEPDMFIVAGDLLNCEGRVNEENARRWALYLDMLFSTSSGYFIQDRNIGGQRFENFIIPHVAIAGNHEMGERHHLRWPTCVNTRAAEPGYPLYVAANWMELLFHWPYRSEGFYNELRPEHPNMHPDYVMQGFGHGGFGALHFSDYLMLIALDNSMNWESVPDKGLRDWLGRPITDQWPWFEEPFADVRQDLWLENLLEPDDRPSASEKFTHILPVWHRGLFGTAAKNMSLKNRPILSSWLPVLYRNGVRLIKEGHDHTYTRTVSMAISDRPPANTFKDRVYYEPTSWPLTGPLDQEYLDRFYAVHVLRDQNTRQIVGWEHEGHYISHNPAGFRVTGHGGWAGGRQEIGARGSGNAGFWFVDPDQGGDAFSGPESFHITVIRLSTESLTAESWHPDQLELMERAPEQARPFSRMRWSITNQAWYDEVF